MSYNQYSGYGGNPYGGDQQSYGAATPYSTDAANPYAGGYDGQAVVSDSPCLARSSGRRSVHSRGLCTQEREGRG